jgi:hypothetical protein
MSGLLINRNANLKWLIGWVVEPKSMICEQTSD